jgi:drug/metabolite transporter (DMT)-like permease
MTLRRHILDPMYPGVETPPNAFSRVARGEGMEAMLLGYSLLGMQPMFVRLASRHGFSPAESVAVRFSITLGLALGTARLLKQSLATENPKLWLLRGFFGGGAVLFYFASVSYAGAGVGTLLNYTYPLWAQLFAFVLGERLRLESLLYLALALGGVYLIVNPGVRAPGLGELSGLVSGILAGGGVLCVKKLRETDGEQTIIVSFSVVGLLYAIVMMLWPGSPFGRLPLAGAPTLQGWLVEGVIGLLSFFGHLFFTRGYKNTSVRLASVLALLVPLIATATGAIFLGERLTSTFTVGAALILASVSVSTWRERTVVLRKVGSVA